MIHSNFRPTILITLATTFAVVVSMHQQKLPADLISVTNGGFEDLSVGTIFNEFSFGVPAGWALYDPFAITGGGAGPQFYLGTLTPNPPVNFLAGAPEGQRVGIAFNFAGTGDLGEYGMQQTLAETLQSNLRYTLSVEVGNIASGTAVNGTFFNLDGFPGYRIDLMAGDVVLTSDNNLLGGAIPEGQFATSTLEFIADPGHAQLGQALSIRLVNLNQIDPLFPGADLEVDFDDVRLTVAAVPEPTAGGLVLLSSMLLSAGRRRSRSL